MNYYTLPIIEKDHEKGEYLTVGNYRSQDHICRHIINTVAKYNNISFEKMVSKRVLGEVVKARQQAIYIMREYCKSKMWPEKPLELRIIASHFTGQNGYSQKDHATIIYSYRKAKTFMEIYPEYKAEMEEIINFLGLKN